MPHLKYCNRHWRIASDELWLPGFCAIFSRFVWLVFVATALGFSAKSLSSCPDGSGIIAYLSITIFLFIVVFLLEVGIIGISIRGTMAETNLRDNALPRYLTMRVTAGALQLAAAIVGCIVVFDHLYVIPCSDKFGHAQSNFDVIVLSIVVVSQILESSILLCCGLMLSSHKTFEEDRADYDLADVSDVWESRAKSFCRVLQICTCNIFGGSNIRDEYGGLEAVAHYITLYFNHDGFLDIVPSDVVAGIILTRIQQQSEINKQEFQNLFRIPLGYQRSIPILPSFSSASAEEGADSVDLLEAGYQAVERASPLRPVRKLNESDEEDRAWVEEVTRSASYSVGMYSHLLVFYMRPITGSCALCFTHCAPPYPSYDKSRTNMYDAGRCVPCLPECGLCSRQPRQRRVFGDNCFRANEAGVLFLNRRQVHAELKFASFHNDLTLKPYAIFFGK